MNGFDTPLMIFHRSWTTWKSLDQMKMTGIATSVCLCQSLSFFLNGVLALGKSICPYLHSDGMEVAEPTQTCTSENVLLLGDTCLPREIMKGKHLLGVASHLLFLIFAALCD